jgi:hypothetical protein
MAKPPRDNQGSTATQLDCSGPAAYLASVDWIRSNVVLRETAKHSVLQLDVIFPKGQVTLFMDPANHYVMGFRGADKIYLLDDANSERFQNDLQLQVKNAGIEILRGFSSAHGPNGLATFGLHNGTDRWRVFTPEDLTSATLPSAYSRASGMTYEQLKKPLSLLICMISESARIPIMQRDFANMMLYGCNVVADDAVRSYDDAKYLIALGNKIFREYPARLAVEKLQKRAEELDSFLAAIQSGAKAADRKKLISDLLSGKMPPSGPSSPERIQRFSGMCAELGLRNPDDITQLLSTCRNESAVRAAKQGVAFPSV